jgi:ferredoxin-NADP reductase
MHVNPLIYRCKHECIYARINKCIYKRIDNCIYTCILSAQFNGIQGNKAMQAFKTWGGNLMTPLINPAKFDFWAQQLGSTSAWNRCFARVISVQTESPETKTLTLKANRNWHGYVAGQHCNVTARIAGRNITRSYSISSDPIDGRRIQITVRREAGGLMSEYLCNDLEVGDRLELGRPFGEMVLPTTMPAHLLLLAAGSGITPMISQIRRLARKGMPTSVTLMYWEKTTADFNFAQELQSIARQYPNFNINLITTREHSEFSLSGRISDELLAQVANIGVVDQVFACGASGFVMAATSICESRNIPLKHESFTPSQPQSVNTGINEYDVYLRRQGLHFRLSNQLPMLEQLESAGVSVPSGCRQGICNTCTCVRKSGTTTDLFSGVVDNEPSQIIKLCVSRTTSNIELDL